jgi:cytochrome c556
MGKAAVASVGSILLVVGFAGSLASCTTEGGGPTRAEADEAALHGVHSEDLKLAMRDMEYRSKEEIAAEIYTGDPPNPGVEKLTDSAAAIAATADRIPNILSQVEMAPAERSEFLALAAQLGSQARQLKSQAQEGNLAAVRQTMSRLDATCNACHSQFRFGGA